MFKESHGPVWVRNNMYRYVRACIGLHRYGGGSGCETGVSGFVENA